MLGRRDIHEYAYAIRLQGRMNNHSPFARQLPKHHQRIHKAGAGMLERARQPFDHLEPHRFPKRDCTRVRAEDEVELHTPEAAHLGVLQRVHDPASVQFHAKQTEPLDFC